MAVFDPTEWIRALDAAQVEYVLVGGYAGVLHGARRPTMDIDIVPRWERGNLERLCALLREAEAVSTTGPRVEAESITPEVLIEREVMTWQSRLGRIDTMVGIPDSDGMPVAYQSLIERAVRDHSLGVAVVVSSLDDVITSKEFAGRRKDVEALPELRRLQRSGGDYGVSDA